MKYLFMVVHRCARSAEESITIPARARHAPLRVYAPSAAKILFTVRREFFNVCETRPVADISITPIAKA